jgi:hypothetical protein
MIGRAGFSTGAAVFALLFAASADADESSAARRATAAWEMDRPYNLVELSGGVLGLPTEVCIKSDESCAQGELSLAIGIHNLYRYHALGFGVGMDWATTLRSDKAQGAPDLERDHTRRYFLVEALFRYYFLRRKDWEGWGGVMLGGVVVNDSWTVKADREPYSDIARLGPGAATIGTEGLSGGVTVGGDWNFLRNFSLGGRFRYALWLLPSKRETSPTLDVASLSGQVNMFSVDLVIAYRIAP